MKNIIVIFIMLIQYGCANDKYYYKNNQKVTITPHDTMLRNNINTDYYHNNKGILLGVRDKLILKINNVKDLNKILDEFNLTIEKTLGKKLYLLKTTSKNLTIDISNRLNEKEFVEYSHPDFIKKRMNR